VREDAGLTPTWDPRSAADYSHMVREVNATGLDGSRLTLWDSLLLLAWLRDLRGVYFVAATSRGGSKDAFKMSTALR
jgi:hypothetical protein